MDHPTHELEAYFAGSATHVQFQAIEAWINADPANARAFMQEIHFRELLGEHLNERRSDNRPVLAELARLEAAQHPDVVTIIDLDEQIREQDKGLLSASDLATAGRYLLRHALTPKRLIYAGVAAALLLGLTIFIAMQGAGAPPPTELVQTPAHPQQIEAPKQAVATLTAARNAIWQSAEREALTPGAALYPGQRLTLTQGFAEITTKRGAVAILEAPVTIELLDNNNAMHLHAGKLVGHCPTQQSKGFLVRTPSTQVIDLGTEFGVEVDSMGETGVYVFTGLVALADPKDDPRNAELTEIAAGQGMIVDRQGLITPLPKAVIANHFVRSMAPNALYERMILADNPLVYYRMDNIIGGIERNVAADRYHAKVVGDVSVVTEAGQSSFTLNTFGDHLQTSEPIVELHGAESYTMECWVRAARYDFGMVCNLKPLHNRPEYPLLSSARIELMPTQGLVGPGKHFRFVHGHPLGPNENAEQKQPISDVFSNNTYALDQWVHLAAVKDGDRMTLYVNGEAHGSAAEKKPLIEEDVLLTLGRFMTDHTTQNVLARQFIGQLDAFALYDHALPAESILARYSASKYSEDRP